MTYNHADRLTIKTDTVNIELGIPAGIVLSKDHFYQSLCIFATRHWVIFTPIYT